MIKRKISVPTVATAGLRTLGVAPFATLAISGAIPAAPSTAVTTLPRRAAVSTIRKTSTTMASVSASIAPYIRHSAAPSEKRKKDEYDHGERQRQYRAVHPQFGGAQRETQERRAMRQPQRLARQRHIDHCV